jgi:protein TonB
VGLALALAVAANFSLVELLANLNRSARTSKPAPPRLTWMAFKTSLQRPEPQSPQRQPRPQAPERRSLVEPKEEQPLLKPQQFQTRSLKPRASFAPSLDIHPELSALSLQLSVNLPGLPAPGLKADWAAYATGPFVPGAGPFAPGSTTDRSAEPGFKPQFGAVPQRAPTLAPRLGQTRATDPVKLREPDHVPMPVYTPRPEYPMTALRQGIEGHVTLRILVGADGKAESVEAMECQGHESFVRAAISVVKRWRFRPAQRDGSPVPFWCAQKISFSLAENQDK